jgi:hypothetical protein
MFQQLCSDYVNGFCDIYVDVQTFGVLCYLSVRHNIQGHVIALIEHKSWRHN